eukprot:356737-Chlamydomonas_euryale.AAC.5
MPRCWDPAIEFALCLTAVALGIVVAAGHEGSGLALGPATAQLVLHHLLGPERAKLPPHISESLSELSALTPPPSLAPPA